MAAAMENRLTDMTRAPRPSDRGVDAGSGSGRGRVFHSAYQLDGEAERQGQQDAGTDGADRETGADQLLVGHCRPPTVSRMRCMARGNAARPAASAPTAFCQLPVH